MRVLILTLLWRGNYSLKVPQSVSVQEGLCVLVPCTFTYPASFYTDNSWAQLFRNWYKDQVDVHWDLPVASSDPSLGVSQETQGRFQLMGDLTHGNCSLQISDAQRMDAGRYFLRVEKGDFKYSYCSNYYQLTEEPEIQMTPARGPPGTLLAGEPVTVTCTAPGRSWNVSAPLANGPWTHSSALSFTPAPGDAGKELICNVTYSSAQGPSTRRTIRLHIGSTYIPQNLPLSLFQDTLHNAVGNGSQLTAREGDSLRFLCSIASSPPATLAWVRGGRAIKGAGPMEGNQLRLELPNVKAEDRGLYGCWAQNNESSAQGTFQLLVDACLMQEMLLHRGWGKGGLGQPMQSAQQGGCKSLPGVSALLLTQHHKTPAARQTKGIQDGAAATKAPLGPGEPDEQYYTSINFSKPQRKGAEPLEAPTTEYSEVRRK
uniref:Ig-like domain-containing protein n=1 Tax=Chrysemys picta bellii TaxID=8478 RepID=A0A8C3F310_CHRPI